MKLKRTNRVNLSLNDKELASLVLYAENIGKPISMAVREILYTMKIEQVNSTCTCESYKNATIKYGAMLDEYFKINEVLRNEVVKLQKQIEELKDYIKYTL